MKRPLWLKIVAACGALYLIYVACGFLLGPLLIKRTLQGRVSEALDRRVAVEEASFNPFTLSVELNGLTVEDDRGDAFVDVGRLYVNPQLLPLITGRVSVKAIALSDSVFNVEIDEEGILNFDRLLQSPDTAEGEPSEPPRFAIALTEIENVQVEVSDRSRSLHFQEVLGPISFTLENLRSDPGVDGPYRLAAEMEGGTAIEWNGSVSLNPVKSWGDFRIENLDISKAKPFWHDVLRAEMAGGFSFSGSYELEAGNDGPRMSLSDGLATLDSATFEDPQDGARFAVDGVSVAGIDASWPEKRVEIESVGLVAPNATMIRASDGSLALPLRENASEAESTANQSEETEAPLSLTVKTATVRSGELELIDRSLPGDVRAGLQDIELEASNIAPFEAGESARLELTFRLSGGGSVRVESVADLAGLKLSGTLSAEAIHLPPFQAYAAQAVDAAIVDGNLNLNIEYNYEGENEILTLESDLELRSLDLRDGGGSEPLIAFESFDVDGASYNGERFRIAQANLRKPTINVVLGQEGLNWQRLAESRDSETAKPADDDAVAAETEPTPFSLDRFSLEGGEVRLTDRTLEPDHRSSVVGIEALVSGVSTEGGDAAEVAFKGGFDRGGTIDLQGELQPLDFRRESRLTLDLSDFDLSATAPYWKKYLGRGLDRGMLRFDTQIEIDKSQLDGSNGIVIDQLTLGEKVESEDSLGLPIGLAVAILKDREGKMELPRLTLSGDLDDPSISIGGIVLKALGNIIVKIATSPFAALGGLVGAGSDEDLSIAPFSQGQVAIENQTRERMDKLGKILVERPGLKIDVTSVVVPDLESKRFQRALISQEARLIGGEPPESEDPIDLAGSFDNALYAARAEVVYRDMMGWNELESDEPEEASASEPADASSDLADQPEVASGGGLVGSVARLLRNVAGKKAPEPSEQEVDVESPPTETESAADAPDLIERQIPPLAEIEAALFASDAFTVDPSWIERLAQERLNRIKAYLLSAHGIESGRVFLAGETTTDANAESSYTRFELTD